MSDRYFALVHENINKTWEYFITDDEDLSKLKEEIRVMKEDGDLAKNARITYFKGEIVE